MLLKRLSLIILIAIVALFLWPAAARATTLSDLYGYTPKGAIASDNQWTWPSGSTNGYVMLIHGGGWSWTGSWVQETGWPSWFAAQHWAAYTTDYRAGNLSLPDVVAAYDAMRAFNPRIRICAQGQSSGGQLALMLAVLRPSLDCVISEAGVLDLTGAPALYSYSDAAWGHDNLWTFSPVRYRIPQPILAVGAVNDPVVPEAQQLAELAAKDPYTETHVFNAGSAPFTHATIDPNDLNYYYQRIQVLLGLTPQHVYAAIDKKKHRRRLTSRRKPVR